MHGLEIFDAEKLWVHGGSMRVYTCKIGKYEKTQRLKDYFEEEKQKGIDTLSHYNLFARNVEQSKNELYNIVMGLKAKGKKIVGYAAASKGTIVLNYCNLGKNVLDYISDSTPFKQGLFSPGKHIPIVAPEFFNNDNADYALLSAWNHAQEIMEKEKNFIARGGRFIVHLPKPRILEPGELIEEKRLEEIKTKKLKVFADDEGYLFETLRNDDDLFDNKFGQVLVSVLYPGVIKGLHRHSKQTDYTTCIKGNVKYIAIKEENGKIDIKTFIIGESNPILIKVPSGYWHGYMPLGNERAIILHTMDKPYNPQDPDTDEINHFSFGDIWNKKN
jgi:dTDP-4-dehydrorhamnose 3,5-epimerase-like enzyme